VSIWVDEAHTQRPVPGQQYPSLYAYFNVDFGFNGSHHWGTDSGAVFDKLTIWTPSDEDPEAPYEIFLYVDYAFDGAISDLHAGGSYQLFYNDADAPVFPADAVVDFYL
jgi:hypothetical protein